MRRYGPNNCFWVSMGGGVVGVGGGTVGGSVGGGGVGVGVEVGVDVGVEVGVDVGVKVGVTVGVGAGAQAVSSQQARTVKSMIVRFIEASFQNAKNKNRPFA
jgi:hypothetical protein